MANEASPNRLTKVWYSLNDRIDSVKVASDADISDLRNAIKAKWGDRLQCAAAELDIFKPGTTSFESQNNQVLDPGDVVPNDTSSNATNGKGPLIVVPPLSLIPQQPLGQLQQQEQQNSLFNADSKRKIDEIYQAFVEDRTEKKSYSDASIAFCNDLLAGLSIRYQQNRLNQEDADRAPLEAFPWTQTLNDGATINRSENEGTQAALDWLKGNMAPGFKVENQPVVLKDVKGKHFQPLRASKKEANGKTDGVVGIQSEIQACEITAESYFSYSMGLVEIKTNRDRLKKPQMFLQLVALSRESLWGQAVVLLGTDCGKSWYLMWFQEHNKICLQQYLHGRKCLEDFEMLLANIQQRKEDLEESSKSFGRVSSLANQEEPGEHDLSIFAVEEGLGTDKDEVDEALENEAFLHRVANELAERYGERPVLPEWALAKNKFPSYYS